MSAPALNLHREGRGRPLVLLHGVAHHWQAYAPVIGRLAAGGHEVLAVDLPGFGRSDPLPGDEFSIPAYADALAEWLRAEQLHEAAVVGNSMGGAIALELARRGLVRAAVAISPAGFWTAAERAYCQLVLGTAASIPVRARPAVLRALGRPAGRAAVFGAIVARPGRLPAHEARATLLDGWRAPATAGALAAFSSYRYPDPRPTVRADGEPPAAVTVAWGSRDLLLPYGLQAPRARRELPEARHVTLPGLGHVPFWDDPGMVARVILGVLG